MAGALDDSPCQEDDLVVSLICRLIRVLFWLFEQNSHSATFCYHHVSQIIKNMNSILFIYGDD